MRLSLISIYLASLGLPACAAHPPAPGDVLERRVGAMGTWLDLRLEGAPRPVLLEASEAAVRAVEAAEARLSTWREDTELAQLNAAPLGQPVTLSPALRRDLEGALLGAELTEGFFDPVLGVLVRLWHLREGGGPPPPNVARLDALAQGGRRSLLLEDGRATRLRPGCLVEEGGFGKGAALDDAARALEAWPGIHGLLDLGGQVLVVGGRARELLLADPRERGRAVLRLRLNGGSAATTGNSERGIQVEGRLLSHVLHPRTGRPVPDFGSLTVLAPGALLADCLSTGLYAAGPEEALRRAAALEGIEALVLTPTPDGGLEARATPGLRGRLEAMDDDLSLNFLAPASGTPSDPR